MQNPGGAACFFILWVTNEMAGFTRYCTFVLLVLIFGGKLEKKGPKTWQNATLFRAKNLKNAWKMQKIEMSQCVTKWEIRERPACKRPKKIANALPGSDAESVVWSDKTAKSGNNPTTLGNEFMRKILSPGCEWGRRYTPPESSPTRATAP